PSSRDLAFRFGSLSSRCRPYPGSTAKSINAPFEERIHRSQVAVLSIGPPDSGGLSGIRFEFVHEFLNVPQGSRQLVDNRDRGALRSAGEGIQVDANHRFLHAYEGLRTVSVFQGDEYHICTEDSFTVREGAFRIAAGGDESLRDDDSRLPRPHQTLALQEGRIPGMRARNPHSIRRIGATNLPQPCQSGSAVGSAYRPS